MNFWPRFLLLLVTFATITIANGFPRGSKRGARDENDNEEKSKCICPGIEKPICGYTITGRIQSYPNLCFAKCSSVDRDNGIGLIPGSICKEILNKNGTLKDSSNPVFQEIWFEEMEKETNFYAEIDKIMKNYLKASGGPDDQACICPAISRPVLSYGQSGSILKYNNICSARCETRKFPYHGIAIFPWRMYERKNPGISFEMDAEQNFDYYLTKWKGDMRNEIQFYKKVYKVMSPLESI